MGIKFDNDPLTVKQNHCLTKIVNVYIAYDFDAKPKNPTINFKICLFAATSIVKNSDKENYVYSGCGITSDSAGSCSFRNDSARNVMIFGVGDSLSSHTDNCKNDFLVLGEGPTFWFIR